MKITEVLRTIHAIHTINTKPIGNEELIRIVNMITANSITID
jgi:hypothetical protein